ncbi:transcriptional regulator, SARP family [Catenulispora acidiphila DSM 44928]|uniref:Transcriptional regulator, SARP family n=1 Tax=Catenulispora acidiphila (strain DSM 44928 / JCM 14897 / NBRC 102108 / NRRL B-24433 / ID139908) TaxID=479433 RepID=C7QCA1_CATAD|nr:transcriptional regulator, SARP family [Catenulispora acidiphila DSM 44928]
MQIGVLGPLSVAAEAGEVRVTGRRRRALLALLALHANQVVHTGRLIETAWGSAAAPTSSDSLPSYILRLRRALGAEIGARILTRPGGYTLELAEDELDLIRFRTLRSAAKAKADSGDWPGFHALAEQALAQWRGDPLADIVTDGEMQEETEALSAAHLELWRDRLDAGLFLGRHAEVAAETAPLVARHPMDERFREQRMLALYHTGRRTQALAVFREVRRLLVDEVGVEPGSRLAEIHARILRGDPEPSEPRASSPATVTVAHPAPRQLPPAPLRFTARHEPIAALDQWIATAGRTAGTVAVVSGPPGVGKTALAVHFAHTIADRFPDGQIYLNLRGFDPLEPPVAAATAMRDVLVALGMPSGAVPTEPAALLALYRSRLSGGRMLLVLDNARDAAQVRSLIPAGPGSIVVVTSRDRLFGLIAVDGGVALPLDALTPAESAQLLAGRLGATTVREHRAAAEEMAQLCSHLPLALTIAAARAAAHPTIPLANWVSELRRADRRLDMLTTGDRDSNVRTVFSSSYHALSTSAGTVFRFLSLHPGPEIGAAAARALTGLPDREARGALDELTRASLVAETVPGRFAGHDLLREYAAELGQEHDPEFARRSGIQRLLDYYLHSAHAVLTPSYAQRLALELAAPVPGAHPEQFLDRQQGRAWRDTESRALIAAVPLAARAGLDRHAWQLATVLAGHLGFVGLRQEQMDVAAAGLAAASLDGDPVGLGLSHMHVAEAHAAQGQDVEALEHLDKALEYFVDLGEASWQGMVLLYVSQACERRADFTAALDAAQRASVLLASVDDPDGQAQALNNAGHYHTELGRPDLGLEHAERALALTREVGNRFAEFAVLDTLIVAHDRLGDPKSAVACGRKAAQIADQLGPTPHLAVVLDHLAQAHWNGGDTAEARTAWQSALAIMEEHQDPKADELRRRLSGLREPTGGLDGGGRESNPPDGDSPSHPL